MGIILEYADFDIESRQDSLSTRLRRVALKILVEKITSEVTKPGAYSEGSRGGPHSGDFQMTVWLWYIGSQGEKQDWGKDISYRRCKTEI